MAMATEFGVANAKRQSAFRFSRNTSTSGKLGYKFFLLPK